MNTPQIIQKASASQQKSNYRILVVDDNPAIHRDFQKILGASTIQDQALDHLESLIFGTARDLDKSELGFEIDCALQGEDSVQILNDAIAEGRPYAMAFVDVRMPPGWDGPRTANELWNLYPGLQVVICTAYSDYTWEQLKAVVKFPDSLVVLKKPFDNIEVQQLAHTMCRKWELNLQSELAIQHLEKNILKLSVPNSSEKTAILDPQHEAELMISPRGHHFVNSLMQLNAAVESTRQQIRHAESQLVQGEKMASLGRMSAGILHEINNPLNFSMAAVSMLSADSKNLPEKIREEHMDMLADLNEGLTRICEITSNLRKFAHPESSQMSLTSIKDSINSAVRLMKAELKGCITVDNRVSAGIMAMTSGNKLSQVFINLIHNSAHALKAKTYASHESPMIVFDTAERNGYLLVTVTDNGSGIPKEAICKIFDPFYTTKEVGEGTGLGLSICHQILKDLKASISVDSVEGSYTRFTIAFPRQS